MRTTRNRSKFYGIIHRDRGLLLGLATMLAFLIWGSHWLDNISSPLVAGAFFAWLVLAILGSAFRVVHEADALAHRLGEPLGTLILTLSVTGMEVAMVSSVMITGPDNPTLARDTMFAVVMIVLAGLVGASLLLGAFRHHQQEFNLEGASAYLSLIVPLSMFGLVMPNFTITTPGPTFSANQALVLAILCVGIYAVFLGIQTLRHREFFEDSEAKEKEAAEGGMALHAIILFISLAPVVFLSEELACILDFGVHTMHLPAPLAGVVVAGLILAPEGLSGIKAAYNNQLQRSVNLLLGSALATIALTIPAVLVVGLLTKRAVVLGLRPHETILLVVTLAISLMTFGRGKTNLLQGAVHLIVFIFWLVLMLEG
ncbi:MAG: calcium:proton antiporter [Verrucomicrobiae bacterium]